MILLSLFVTDIVLHRGMSRVIVPDVFSDKVKAVNLRLCDNQLLPADKYWIKAVNNIELMHKLPDNTAGIECDVYFDMNKTVFEVYHDSAAPSSLNADSLLSVYASKKLSANIWLDFKNLTQENAEAALKEVTRLKNKYSLKQRLIIESPHPEFLKIFCESGFFTSYYVPFFNPYKSSEKEIIQFADSVRKTLAQHPTSAISGYYFQYPILKKFFPNYPILIWADHSSFSLVSYVFKQQLENEQSVKVVLFPFND